MAGKPPFKVNNIMILGLGKLGRLLAKSLQIDYNVKILEDNKVGVAIKDFEEISLKKGLEELIAISKSEGIRYHCWSVSLDLFSLDVGVRSYEQVYASLEGK